VPPLPLPALRLMVPPLRLVSAAIWQTIQQSHVMDYGMLEEFVTMVTDVVPELLNDSQRAQLILGLRARLVLELCRSKPFTDLQTIQQHLYSVFKADAEVGLSESSFLGLVQTLLKDPDEREHFFQDVFPVEFGSSYDAAIQKLMWQFLSRLEKLLPVSNFQQVLVEIQLYRGTMGLTLTQLTHIDVCFSSVGTKTFSLYKTDSETHVSSLNVFMDTFTKELEVDSATLAKYTEMEPGTNMDVIAEDRMAPLVKTNKFKGLKRDRNDTSEPVRRNRGLCGRVLSRFSDMKKHMQTHKNGRTYQCRNCQKTFKHLYTLQTHRKSCLFGTGQQEEIPSVEGSSVPFTMCEAEFAQSSIDPKAVQKASPEGEDTEPQIKRPKCSSTAKKSNRKTFQKPKHMCRICGKYVTAGAFEYHMRTHSGERPFSCPHPQCGMKFIHSGVDAAELDSFNIRFECDKCEKTFTIQSKLRKHKLIHGPLYCTGCRKVLPDLETLTRHKLWHRPVQCSMCEESFMLTNLRTHYLDVHKFSGPFVCTHCPKSYKKFHSLIKHEMVHTGNLPLQCSQCPKRFIYNYDLVEHEKRHSDDRPCLCWECGKAFCTNIDLKQHMQNSHGEKSTECRFPCRHCGKPFRLSNSRANHEKTKHGGVRYPCTYCGKQFVCANALKRHDLIHTGERPFKCNHKSCDKAFRSRAELRIHTRYHTGERPFKCNVCGKGFVQANYLTTHYRTHTGEKPYSCSVCDKSFNYHDSLKRHMSTHSNEKPYKCLDCGKAFERKTLLNVHKRSCTSLLKC
uniref:C2H2-type domain-containing protein n=1 Tax=Oncorhynchus kisutch TaxID=8019 RepID=A0A8C7NBV6_ONCKI